jgi:hypothetical protein
VEGYDDLYFETLHRDTIQFLGPNKSLSQIGTMVQLKLSTQYMQNNQLNVKINPWLSHSHPLNLAKNQKEELFDLKIKTKIYYPNDIVEYYSTTINKITFGKIICIQKIYLKEGSFSKLRIIISRFICKLNPETNFTKWENAANREEVEYQYILNRAKVVEINQIPFINQNWFKHVEK